MEKIVFNRFICTLWIPEGVELEFMMRKDIKVNKNAVFPVLDAALEVCASIRFLSATVRKIRMLVEEDRLHHADIFNTRTGKIIVIKNGSSILSYIPESTKAKAWYIKRGYPAEIPKSYANYLERIYGKVITTYQYVHSAELYAKQVEEGIAVLSVRVLEPHEEEEENEYDDYEVNYE